MNYTHITFKHLMLMLVVVLLASCKSAKDISYLQNLQTNVPIEVQEEKAIKLKPGDRLNIVVHSRDEELVRIFNVNTTSANNSNNIQIKSYYTVDSEGSIDFPTLGLIPVMDKTRQEVANEIKNRLLTGNLVRDAVVTVDFANMGFYALGEVGKKGRIEITRDKMNILEAISEAGDLTIDGKRKNVTVIRTENGVQTPYRIDLTDANSIYSSPAFYIQQNDIVYVEPTKKRANESKPTANMFNTPTFWMGLASFAITVLNFVLK